MLPKWGAILEKPEKILEGFPESVEAPLISSEK